MSHKKERRKSRRVITTLGAVLSGPGAEPIAVETLNLSAGGVYVVTSHYFAPFTKVQLALVLPPFGQEQEGGDQPGVQPAAQPGEEPGKGGREAQETSIGPEAGPPIQIEGIVVRSEPDRDRPESHSVAIAFLHLAPEVRNRIEAYVTWRLERSLIESAGSLGAG